MLRPLIFLGRSAFNGKTVRYHSFLTSSYKCADAWNARTSSPILQKVNLNDFYNEIDQSYSFKGVISSIDVDIYANALNDGTYLDELRDVLYKLRMSAETGNMLPSTPHATIRSYLDYGNIQDLIEILSDPLNYGIFLDDFTANLLLDKLLGDNDYEKAATVASIIMLQEDYSNEITRTLSLYSCYKYLSNPPVKEEVVAEDSKPEKKEELKIRIKYLRNPYFDDHFDLKDPILLAGKTLAWMSEGKTDYTHFNLQIIGWLFYQKYDKLMNTVKVLSQAKTPIIYKETLDFLQNIATSEKLEDQMKADLENVHKQLSSTSKCERSLEDDLKTKIEDAINKTHTADIKKQVELFKSWEQLREDKLEEQSKRLDKAKRVKLLEEKQKELEAEEQRLWFFENEDKIDLIIEGKRIERTTEKVKGLTKSDEDYIPPEILPKRQ